jgi:putative addiction module component (TIGR02574 family)
MTALFRVRLQPLRSRFPLGADFPQPASEVSMAQMTTEVCKLLEQALSLSVEEQEALADSLIRNLGGKVDEGVQQAWEAEIGKRAAELDSGKARTASWEEVRRRNLAKVPHAQ